ncbi:hypothetical protein BC829DRAFT_494182 [Chytridium lagenaria]|nr:hypothetical protein BC829DRAFT_494182 [Chytridium lagenaria]
MRRLLMTEERSINWMRVCCASSSTAIISRNSHQQYLTSITTSHTPTIIHLQTTQPHNAPRPLLRLRGNLAAITLNTLLLILILLQYYFLILSGIRITPSLWPTLLNRYFHALSPDCHPSDPALPLQEDKIKAEFCYLTPDTADSLFDILGLNLMTRVERFEVFRTLDVDRDGVLRWPEIVRTHTWVWDGEAMGGNGTDVGNFYNVTRWEIYWASEVWRRGRDMRSWFGYGGDRVLTRRKILFGSGLDSSLPEFFY